MGILSNIFGKIFPPSYAANTSASAPAGVVPSAAPAPTAAVPTAAATQTAALSQVDVEQVLNNMASKSSEKLNWKTSIVDLLKLLGLDSSLAARKELANELHYTGDTGDSASMNVWLHRQVMNKVAANGGTVPADLQD